MVQAVTVLAKGGIVIIPDAATGQAAPAVAHGRIVEVLDRARGAGGSRLAIAIVPRERGARP
jgi:hypothetical protein